MQVSLFIFNSLRVSFFWVRISSFGIYIVRGLADDGGVADGVLELEALVAERCAADRVEQNLRNMNAVRETDLSRISPSVLEYTKSIKIDDLVAKIDELVTESAACGVLSFFFGGALMTNRGGAQKAVMNTVYSSLKRS